MSSILRYLKSISEIRSLRFEYQGLYGSIHLCFLRIINLIDGRTAVIVAHPDNERDAPLYDITECLATAVCDYFNIQPGLLVWIERRSSECCDILSHERFEIVSFNRRPATIDWSLAARRHQPSGWPSHFEDPKWQPMSDADWESLGLYP